MKKNREVMENETINKKQTRGGEGLKNKAFTLIELLGVIIIIGIIALIAVPIVMNIIGKVRKAAFERSVEGLIKSVEINTMDSFLVPREYFYEKGTLTLLTVKGNTRDEKIGTHGKIVGSGFIYVDKERTIHVKNLCDKNYCANGEEKKIEITPNPDGKIPELDEDYPVITLNGEKIVYVEIGGVYKEEGVIAKTIGGKELEYTKEIKYNDETVEAIETTREGEYTITYSTENAGKRVSVTRKVIVKLVGMSGSDLATKANLLTVAGAKRYQGTDPDNYVTFNGEAYRIIGVFEDQLKIIYWGNYTTKGGFYKNTPMAWDSSNVNDWSQASLMTELNTTYWNTINSIYQNMVDQNHVWKLGGSNTLDITREQMYQYENGTTVYPGRPTTWIGKIALMYPSDYANASSGGNICDSSNLSDWSNGMNYIKCAQNTWLYNTSQMQWTLTSNSSILNRAIYLFMNGLVTFGDTSSNGVSDEGGIRPVMFLKSNVKIIEGNGSKNSPYILGI